MKLIDEVRGTKVERDRICAERTMSTLAWNCPRGKSFGVQHSTKIVPKYLIFLVGGKVCALVQEIIHAMTGKI